MHKHALPAYLASGSGRQRQQAIWTRWGATLMLGLLLALVPLLAQGLDQPFLIRVFTRIVVFAIAAVSLNILLGYAGLVSVMHAGLLGIGGYVVGILAAHDGTLLIDGPIAIHGTANLAISVPLAVVASALAAALFGAISLRTSGAYFIMITLAFNQMLYYFFISLENYGGDEGLQINTPLHFAGADIGGRTGIYYLCLGVLMAVLIAGVRLVESRFGVVIRAANGNERRVASVGIAPMRYRLAAIVITGAVAGLAGALLAVSQQFISPADMAWSRSGELIIMVVLGGMTYVWGPAIGAAAFLLLELGLSGLTIHWQLPFGIFIILLIMFLRGGLTDLVGVARKIFGGRFHE
ncbi:MAG: branched-chain amino acid ABC transporter permease [Pseudomonadota bacterium]